MHDLKQIELPQLLDLLTSQTGRHVQMIKDNNAVEGITISKEIIKQILDEIDLRLASQHDEKNYYSGVRIID